jgi:hypothetical protein
MALTQSHACCFLLEVSRASLNYARGAGMAGMDDAFAQAEQCRRLASGFRAKAAETSDVEQQQQTLQELARHYDALSQSWFALADSRSKLRGKSPEKQSA